MQSVRDFTRLPVIRPTVATCVAISNRRYSTCSKIYAIPLIINFSSTIYKFRNELCGKYLYCKFGDFGPFIHVSYLRRNYKSELGIIEIKYYSNNCSNKIVILLFTLSLYLKYCYLMKNIWEK